MKLNISSTMPRVLLRASCLAALLVAPLLVRAADETMSSAPAVAESESKGVLNFLKPGQIEASVLLSPPPLIDSPEQAAEMDEVHKVYGATSDEVKQAAYGEKKFSVYNFNTEVGAFFVATNLPKTTAFFEKVQIDAETVTDAGKDYFKRPRPFVTDPSLVNGKLEKSFSYPSGHSTESMVLALVLADLVPERADAIIAHARNIGWHRVQIARHYPSDIFAGRILARNIARELKQSDEYQKEFAEAKKEIEAARATARN
jgi:acid phosphatase (class A)